MGKYTAPDWQNAALVTVDVQNDFTLPGAPSEIPGTAEVVPAIRRLVGAFRGAGRPIVHVVRLYREDGSNVDACRREAVEEGENLAARPGTDGAELVDGLKPSPGVRLDAEMLLGGEMQGIGRSEWVVYKPRWGAFFQTPLHEHLQGLGVNTLVVCGCNFPNCPRTTVYEASERDYRAVAVRDAISGAYERGMRELEGIGVETMRAEACLEGLGARVAGREEAKDRGFSEEEAPGAGGALPGGHSVPRAQGGSRRQVAAERGAGAGPEPASQAATREGVPGSARRARRPA